MAFRVCTYNMGTDHGDYERLRAYVRPSEDRLDKDTLQQTYLHVQQEAAQRLSPEADVFLLQEVCMDEGKERLFIQKLRERNFQILQHNKGSNCVIALGPMFEKVQNDQSVFLREKIGPQPVHLDLGDAAIATAIHRPTGQAVTFVSALTIGCHLEGAVHPDDAHAGDQYCLELARTLDSLGSKHLQIIGIDMNANPEKWNPRFVPFLERNFQILRSNAPTNVNPVSPTYKERELDFFLVRWPPSGLTQKLFSFISSSKRAELTDRRLLGWNIEINPSDHLPLIAHVNL